MIAMEIRCLKKLVKIGLEYDVDQTYVLEDIEKILNGGHIDYDKIKPENYM